MFNIEVNGTSANIYLDNEKGFYFEHGGDSPAKAVMNLIFFMEKELDKLENVDEDMLTPVGQEKMRLLQKFIKKLE